MEENQNENLRNVLAKKIQKLIKSIYFINIVRLKDFIKQGWVLERNR
jgi:hypothetical protein